MSFYSTLLPVMFFLWASRTPCSSSNPSFISLKKNKKQSKQAPRPIPPSTNPSLLISCDKHQQEMNSIKLGNFGRQMGLDMQFYLNKVMFWLEVCV